MCVGRFLFDLKVRCELIFKKKGKGKVREMMCLSIVADILTIIGFTVVCYTAYEIVYKKIVIFDMYREPNESGGDTLVIGDCSRMDYKRGKEINPSRKYHLKGYPDQDEKWWK